MKGGVEARGCPDCSSHLPSITLGNALDPGILPHWLKDLMQRLHCNWTVGHITLVGRKRRLLEMQPKLAKEKITTFPDRESNPGRGGESAES